MKQRPRVYKGSNGWMVDRPGYGFGNPSTTGPHPSQAAALGSLRGILGYGSQDAERTDTPAASYYRYGGHKIWPVEVR